MIHYLVRGDHFKVGVNMVEGQAVVFFCPVTWVCKPRWMVDQKDVEELHYEKLVRVQWSVRVSFIFRPTLSIQWRVMAIEKGDPVDRRQYTGPFIVHTNRPLIVKSGWITVSCQGSTTKISF